MIVKWPVKNRDRTKKKRYLFLVVLTKIATLNFFFAAKIRLQHHTQNGAPLACCVFREERDSKPRDDHIIMVKTKVKIDSISSSCSASRRERERESFLEYYFPFYVVR
jgi:hypothetical protein